MRTMQGIAPDVDPKAQRGLLTAAGLAEMVHVHESTVYRWASAGVIPCLRIGSTTVRFDIEAVTAALGGENEMDHRVAINRMIRDRAIERARETWVAEIPHCHGAVIIVRHPGQKLDRDAPDFAEKLMQEHGVRPDQLKLLSDSWAAPQPMSVDAEIEAAERELAQLRAHRAAREITEDELVRSAEAKVVTAKAPAGK